MGGGLVAGAETWRTFPRPPGCRVDGEAGPSPGGLALLKTHVPTPCAQQVTTLWVLHVYACVSIWENVKKIPKITLTTEWG